MPQPIVAAMHGIASGGGFCLAMATDIRLATETARMNAVFIRIGLGSGDIGASYMLQPLFGAARAAYSPSVSLTGGVGVASGSIDDLFNGDGSSGWTFTLAIDLPIFDLTRRRGNLDAASAEADAALATYQSTIQQAFREVADAAAVAGTIDRRLQAVEQLAEDTQVTFDLSGEPYKSGLDGYLTVLDAQREYYNAQQQLILARLDNNLNSIALYKALGTWSED
jgi:multidrug efflux system outer membrane protein